MSKTWSIYLRLKHYLTVLYIKMINYDDITGEYKKENNPNCSHIPGHPYIILIIGYSALGKTNALLKGALSRLRQIL